MDDNPDECGETLPPHDDAAERGVLGCIMLSANECIPLCVEKLKGPECFYDLKHRAIYECALVMWQDKEPIDGITLPCALRDLMKLGDAGGLAYVAGIPDTVPSSANLGHYLEIVREKFVLRSIITACAEAARIAHSKQDKVDEIIQTLGQSVQAIIGMAAGKTTLRKSKELAASAADYLDKLMTGSAAGLTTGLTDLDYLLGGLKSGEVFVIAARPSVGKSSLMSNIADHVAIVRQEPVEIFSLEMSATRLYARSLCSRASVSMVDLRHQKYDHSDLQRLANSRATLQSAPIFIDEGSDMSILQLRAKAKQAKDRYGIKLFCIDYLQLLHGTNPKASRQEQVAEISRGIKAMAMELDVPVIVLAQLNRESEKENRKPRLSDLRESGSVEQDTDIAGLLYTKKPENDLPPNPAVSEVGMVIAKNRDGETGEIPLVFLKKFTRFESAAKPAAQVPDIADNFPAANETPNG